jgi:glucose-6-phosphate isomerase
VTEEFAMNSVDTIIFDRSRAAEPTTELLDATRRARETLERGDGPGGELTGWLELPTRITAEEIGHIEATASKIREREALVVIGIGGSQLGSQAAIDALGAPAGARFPVHYAGHQLDAGYHAALLELLERTDFALNVISKSGGTTEPAIAFRLLRRLLEERGGGAAPAERIFVTTGQTGSLRRLALEGGLTVFDVPEDVGGRFSVLSTVGLLPIAAAGFDIRALLEGAAAMAARLRDPAHDDLESNPALAYAACRHAAARDGRPIEVLACCTPRLRALAGWWKQLFGESEGKEGRGIFPAAVDLSTDLHSLGQWLQDGAPLAFETAIDVRADVPLEVPPAPGDDDGLGILTGRPLHQINRAMLAAALTAHAAAGTPCGRLELPDLSERTIGALLYFFEYACGISAYLLGVNPFDQPGVEAYKRELRALLGQD